MTVGLSAAEVAERVEQGRTNQVPDAPTRTTGEIVRANVLTPVNLVISVLLVAIVVAEGIGPDMLFGGVIVTNSVIGIIQELRARAALDRLAVLTTPRSVAWRDGVQRDLDVAEVVEDDLLVLAPGAQVVVDGTVVESSGLELNESLLTGEQDAVHKAAGDEVLSGSFVAVGSGTYRAVRVGAASYAAGLAEEARRFTLVDSELRRGVNTILKVLMALIPPIAAILFWRLLETGEGWRQALSGVVAAAVAMVPDGLVLLTSLAFMAGVVTLARRGALLRELASVELLARVDTLCLDKTGTITTGELAVSAIEPLGDEDAASTAAMLAAVAAADADPNPTLAAVADAAGEVPHWPLIEAVAFSSARKWAAAQFTRPAGPEDTLTLYLGAPELLAPDDPALTERVAAHAAQGRRVLLLVRCAEEVELDEQLPEQLEPVALVLLEDRIRPDAQETLGYFAEQGIRLLVISGDHPGTVAAVARRAGVPDADVGVDARTLPEDPDELADELDRHAVYGRVTPRQKRAMVLALQSRDRVVAMTGDGVNDVLALKDADMGIAMGSGSGASRSVAQLVLLEDRFSILPGVLAEGRRVMNSVERASNLFIYGTVYAVLVSLVIAAIGVEFPFLPRHLTLVRVLSVGVPGFFLALAPDPRRARAGFLDRVVRFSLPAGAIAATGALVVYLTARSTDGVGLTESRTATTVALLGIGLILLVRLTGSLPPWRWALVSAMVVATVAVVFVAPLAAFFDLELPPASVLWVVVGVLGAAALAIQLVPVDDAAPPGGWGTTRGVSSRGPFPPRPERTDMAFELPPLPYAQDALAPHISAETLEYHYGKHHQTYVTNLNKLTEGTDHADAELTDVIMASDGGLFNNSAQVWNHTFYWNSMAPGGGGQPTGEVGEAINSAFGSYDTFREKFAEAATTQFGSGWAWLVDSGSGLEIMKTANADLPMKHSSKALLTIDVWEHAYYIDFRNARPNYISTFLDHLVNWDFVAQNMA